MNQCKPGNGRKMHLNFHLNDTKDVYIFGMEEGSQSKEEDVSCSYRSLDTNCGTATILDLGFRFNYGKN